MAGYPPPEGHHTITPAFMVRDAAAVLDWIEKALGGHVVDRYDAPDGSIAHAEVMIGDCVVMLGEPMPDGEPMPAALSYYVGSAEEVDATYARAIEAGATSESEPENRFYGYRSATVRDRGGNRWTICAVIEQITSAQMHARMAKMMGGG